MLTNPFYENPKNCMYLEETGDVVGEGLPHPLKSFSLCRSALCSVEPHSTSPSQTTSGDWARTPMTNNVHRSAH